MKTRAYSDNDIIEAVKQSFSIRQVLLTLKLTPHGGGSYTTIHRAIKRLNLDTAHFKGQGWSAGRSFSPIAPIEDYLSGKRSMTTHRLRLRLLKEGMFQPVCSSCKLDKWLDGSIPLELDHIDGNRDNNSLDNLRLLCPNCHALTPTHAGKNRGKYFFS